LVFQSKRLFDGMDAEDVLRLQFIRDGRLSPDGQWVAYEMTRASACADRFEVYLLDLESGAQQCISGQGDGRYPRWSPDGRWLVHVESGEEGVGLVLTDVGTRQRREIPLTDAAVHGPPACSPSGQQIAVVLATLHQESSPVRRITSRDFRADGIGLVDGGSQRLCLIDVTQGTVATLVDELGFYTQMEWDDAGRRILFLGTRSPIPGAGYSPTLYIVDVSRHSLRQPLSDGWFIGQARWLPNGMGIAFIGAYRSTVTIPTTDLWVLDLNDGTASCRSNEHPGRVGFRLHHDMPIWDVGSCNGLIVRDAESAWVNIQYGGQAEIWRVSLSGELRSSERIVGGERACLLLDAHAGTDRMLFLATDMRCPPDLHLLESTTERRITRANDDVLATWPRLRLQSLQFRSEDGTDLEGWFIAREDSRGPLPTVLFIHGGPFMAAGHAFRFDFHLLAARGFGVLFANFRGSFGYGESFARAIMGDWGARGFPDHMAAVERAIELGLADRDRLAVWGASHGGFATAWVVGHTHRFRAAVAEASITDLTTAYYLSDAPDFFSRDLGGRPHEIPDVYRSRSPITYAHRVTTPTLLIHGEKDFRCPISQAEQFYRALLDAGCTTEMVRLRDADHMGDSMGPPAARVGQNAALIDWFERFL
jgi:dipeptidyl aminopeptidase/acylaminoacyl peptidase